MKKNKVKKVPNFEIRTKLNLHIVKDAKKGNVRTLNQRQKPEEYNQSVDEYFNIAAAQRWLESINYRCSIEQVQTITNLRLQLYGDDTPYLISNENMRHIKVLVNLENLALPPWTNDEGLRNVTGLSKLKYLDMPRASITDSGMKHLENLINLQNLIISSCSNITNNGISKLSKLTNLKILHLHKTGLTDAGMSTIGKLVNLEILGLNYTNITDNCINQITKLNKLVRIDLNGTQISDVGKEEIRQNIPGISIY
jgi:Leucine-rich repeat (LRR) protein